MISIKNNGVTLYDVYEYTFSESVMGESTISLPLFVPPTIVENFSTEYYVEYNNKRYYLKTKLPTGQKSTDSLMYEYTLLFVDTGYQLRRAIVRDLATIAPDTYISKGTAFQIYATFDTYTQLLLNNIKYNIGDNWSITVTLNTPPTNSVAIDVNNLYIWELLLKSYEYYGVTWRIDSLITNGIESNVIVFSDTVTTISHVFKYQSGLSKIVRAPESGDSYNRISGAGGTKNIPVNYFSNRNTKYPSDPNPIDSGVIIRNLMPSVFRDSVIAQTLPYIDYVEDATLVANDGVKEASLPINEDIYPSIANVNHATLGLLDEIVYAEKPTIDIVRPETETYTPVIVHADIGSLPDGFDVISTGNLFDVTDGTAFAKYTLSYTDEYNNTIIPTSLGLDVLNEDSMTYVKIYGQWVYITAKYELYNEANVQQAYWDVGLPENSNGTLEATNLANGKYYFKVTLMVSGIVSTSANEAVQFSADTTIYNIQKKDTERDQLFYIWIKDIGIDIAEGFNLADDKYTTTEEAKIVFNSGMLAGREFVIHAPGGVRAVEQDTSQNIGGVPSKWRITLIKSDADVDNGGFLMPNTRVYAQAGDRFVITGINMPQAYVELAEQRLTNYLTTQLNAVKHEKQTYSVEIDPIFLEEPQLGNENLVLSSNTGWNTTNEYNVIQGTLSEDWIVGQTYTISIKGSINTGNQFGLWRDIGYALVAYNIPYDPASRLYKHTFVCPQPDLRDNATLNRFSIYNYPEGTATSATIEYIKIEKGNISTEWTQSPDDIIGIKQLLRSGNKISIQDDKLAPTEVSLYINGVTIDYKDNILPDYTLTLSNTLSVNGNQVERLQSQVEVISNTLLFGTAHQHTNKSLLDGVTSNLIELWNSAVTDKHTHANKATLDKLTDGVFVSLTKFSDMFTKEEIEGISYIKANYPLYSIGEISAYGAGSGSGGGGTSFIRLDEWAIYTNDKSGWVLSALLGKDLHDRVLVLEAGGGGGGSTVEWGAITNGYRQLTVDGVTYALAQNTHTHLWADITDKPSTFAPSTHTHTWASIESKPNVITGTTASFTTELETKLNGIAAGANNYTHPVTHAPSIIAQDTNNRFVTDDNIAIWNAKEPAIVKLTAFNKNFGTTAGTVSEGNHAHTFDSLTSRPTTLSGYGITDATPISTFNAHNNDSVRHITGTERTNWDSKANGTHTHYKSDIVDFVHSHSTSDITSGTFAIARIPTGTTGATVALGNHLHTGVYEPVLGNPSANGYLLSSTTAGVRSWVAPYSLPIASASVLGGVKIGANVSIASGVISVHNPVTIGTANGLSLSTQVLSLSLATTAANGALSATDKTYIELLKTFFEYDSTNNAIKALKSFYSTGEVSAYGLGSTGGGGGVGSLVIWGTESAGAVPLTVEGVTKTLSLASHTHTFESITSKPTTLSGYGITDALLASDVYAWAKAATKPYYVWSEIGSKPTTFAPSAHTHYKSDIVDFSHTHNLSEIGITGLTANYLTKYNGSTLVNSKIYDNGTNVGIGTAVPTEKVEILGSAFINNGSLYIGSKLSRMSTNLTTGSYDFNYNTGATGQLAFYGGGTTSVWNVDALGNGYFSGNVGIGTTDPTAKLDVNGIGKFKDDILTSFKTTAWSYDTSKSLKLFLDKFDIDTAGNLVVKTNLYSTGEVTAYSSGTGVSGLKLMGDMDANGKNITNVGELSANSMQCGIAQVFGGDDSYLYVGDGNMTFYNSDVTGESYIDFGYMHLEQNPNSGKATIKTNIVEFRETTTRKFEMESIGNVLKIRYNGNPIAQIDQYGTYTKL